MNVNVSISELVNISNLIRTHLELKVELCYSNSFFERDSVKAQLEDTIKKLKDLGVDVNDLNSYSRLSVGKFTNTTMRLDVKKGMYILTDNYDSQVFSTSLGGNLSALSNKDKIHKLSFKSTEDSIDVNAMHLGLNKLHMEKIEYCGCGNRLTFVSNPVGETFEFIGGAYDEPHISIKTNGYYQCSSPNCVDRIKAELFILIFAMSDLGVEFSGKEDNCLFTIARDRNNDFRKIENLSFRTALESIKDQIILKDKFKLEEAIKKAPDYQSRLLTELYNII